MNLLNIRKVGYGVRTIEELRAPIQPVAVQPTCAAPAAPQPCSILDDARFSAPAPACHSTDDRFAGASAEVGGEISEQNVERVIRQVLERLGK